MPRASRNHSVQLGVVGLNSCLLLDEELHERPDRLHDEVRQQDVGEHLLHLPGAWRAGLGEVAADHRERGHVERVDEQVEHERVVGVGRQPLDRVSDHDQCHARRIARCPRTAPVAW